MIYIFIFAICIVLSILVEKQRNNYFKWTYVGIIILVLSIFSGLRDIGVGIDTEVYVESYKRISYTPNFGDFIKELIVFDAGDKGIFALSYLSYFISDELWSSMFLYSLWTFGFAIVAGYLFSTKYNFRFSYFLLLYLLLFFNTTMNHMRQHCAISVIMLAYYLLDNKKYTYSIVLLIIAYFFHSSAVLAFVYPLIMYINDIKNTKIRNIILFVIVASVVIAIRYFSDLVIYLSGNDLIQDAYTDRYLGSTAYQAQSSINIYKSTYLILPFFIYWYGYRKTIFDNKNHIYFQMVQTVFFITYLLSFISVYLFRLAYYFQFIQFIAIPMVLTSKKCEPVVRIGIIGFLFFIWYYDFIHRGFHGTYPYRSFILGI